MKFKATWYDPPSGWAHGFPKAWPEGLECTKENLRKQLTIDGYPAKDITFAINHTRFGGNYVEETDSN